MITILSVLSKKDKSNKNNSNLNNQNSNFNNNPTNNSQEHHPCSRCKSKDHFNLECMYKNISK